MTHLLRHTPGDHPVVLVGAGFPIAVTDPPAPSTRDILQETATKHRALFPAIESLVNGPLLSTRTLKPNKQLSFVWTHLRDFALTLLPQYDKIRKRYKPSSVGKRFSNLVQYLLETCSPSQFLLVVLGVELKRAVALHYDSTSIAVSPKKVATIHKLLDSLAKKQVTWICLNYDLVLESVLNQSTSGINWKYCFRDLLEPSPSKKHALHVVAKPHGSVNVIFETRWDSQRSHRVDFQDLNNVMASCDHNEVGCDSLRPPLERRPWLVGYLPDEMKDELNSPGGFADAAHDLCKANLAFASLRLLHASSLYVLGYSMPVEDEWIWARLNGLPDKTVGVYVATASDTDSVLQRFTDHRFTRGAKLTRDGKL
jgi:hypothetical protein